MKTALPLVALILGAALAPACSNDFERSERTSDSTATAGAAAPAAAPHAGGAPANMAFADAGSVRGEVLETMDAGGYTYVLVGGDGGQSWAAAPEFDIAVGTKVAFSTQMPMRDFTSEVLGRTFDLVYFVGEINVLDGAAAGAGAPAHGGMAAAPHGGGAQPAADIDVAPAEGGHTVEALFAEASSLAGKSVSFRGEVVKWNSGILGRNWLHVQDGTGSAGTNDITVTTDDVVAVGDTVVVHGTLALDRDFGAGYRYDVIVEGARVTIE